MKRYLTVASLRETPSLSEVIECHRQTWRDGSEWKGYEHVPRFADGLMLVCSQIRAFFTTEDGSTLTAERGDLIHIPEGVRYRVRFLGGGKGTDIYTVNFRLRDGLGNRLCLGEGLTRLTNGAPQESYTLASQLADICLSPDENLLRKHSVLFALLDAIGEKINSRSEDYYIVRRGARLLIKEWNQSHPVSRYAEASEISETVFYRHFKVWSGASPVEYRTKMRISAARSLLRNSSLRISEIAAQIGFDDPYYFSRIFKKSVGISPRLYRESPSVEDERGEKST